MAQIRVVLLALVALLAAAVPAVAAPEGSTFLLSSPSGLGALPSGKVNMTLRIERARAGRRKGRRCVKPPTTLRCKRKCTRFTRAGTLTRQAAAGPGRLTFSGRIRRRALKPGRYRAVVRAADPAGNSSAPRRLTFRIVRR